MSLPPWALRVSEAATEDLKLRSRAFCHSVIPKEDAEGLEVFALESPSYLVEGEREEAAAQVIRYGVEDVCLELAALRIRSKNFEKPSIVGQFTASVSRSSDGSLCAKASLLVVRSI